MQPQLVPELPTKRGDHVGQPSTRQQRAVALPRWGPFVLAALFNVRSVLIAVFHVKQQAAVQNSAGERGLRKACRMPIPTFDFRVGQSRDS